MPGPLLSVQAVSKSYARGQHELAVLREITFAIAPGEIAALLGARSDGKTTMLRIAAGLEPPDAGGVSFDGRDLASLSDARLSRLMGEQIAWVDRSGPAIGTTMLDYVAMPLFIGRGNRDPYRRAREALHRVGVASCSRLHWGSLSDSERARAALAHAIVRRPRLMIVDDLTKHLGIGETDELTALLHDVARETGTAVLMAVSDAAAALRSDRIMTLSAGRVIEAPAPVAGDNVIEFRSPHAPAPFPSGPESEPGLRPGP